MSNERNNKPLGLLERLKKQRSPHQARIRRTRKVILEAARYAFNIHGYQRATIKDIASNASVSVGAIYEHFNSKKAMLLEVGQMEVDRIRDESFQHLNQAVTRRLAGHTVRIRDVIRMALYSAFDSWSRYPRLLAVLADMAAQDQEFSLVVEEHREEAIAFIQDLIMLFTQANNEQTQVSARVLYRMLEGVVQHYTLRDSPFDEDKIVKELTAVIIRYIFGQRSGMPQPNESDFWAHSIQERDTPLLSFDDAGVLTVEFDQTMSSPKGRVAFINAFIEEMGAKRVKVTTPNEHNPSKPKPRWDGYRLRLDAKGG